MEPNKPKKSSSYPGANGPSRLDRVCGTSERTGSQVATMGCEDNLRQSPNVKMRERSIDSYGESPDMKRLHLSAGSSSPAGLSIVRISPGSLASSPFGNPRKKSRSGVKHAKSLLPPRSSPLTSIMRNTKRYRIGMSSPKVTNEQQKDVVDESAPLSPKPFIPSESNQSTPIIRSHPSSQQLSSQSSNGQAKQSNGKPAEELEHIIDEIQIEDKEEEQKENLDHNESLEYFTPINRWGLPDGMVAYYESKGITELFEWQIECLRQPGVLDGKNLVYSAPTSAGKTLVTDILMVKRVIENKRKAIFIQPYNSVTREKMHSLSRMLKRTHIRVDGFFGSHSPPGGLIKTDIAVCNIEKANNLINRLIEDGGIRYIGMIVVDELHMIGDGNRGYMLELMLSKIVYLNSKTEEEKDKIQIVGMSATMPNFNSLASWLNAVPYQTDFRPVPLIEMVKIKNEIKESSSGALQQTIPPPASRLFETIQDTDEIVYLALQTIAEGYSVLIFESTRLNTEKLAVKIAKNIGRILACPEESPNRAILEKNLKPAEINTILESLRSLPVKMDENLAIALEGSSAFHHAGLTSEEKSEIEDGFKCGTIKVLVATSTLAAGVNLPARRVIVASPFGPFNKPYTVAQYKQMIGRAGRMGEDQLGESILIVRRDTSRPDGINQKDLKQAEKVCSSKMELIESCLSYTIDPDSGNTSIMERALLEVIADKMVTNDMEIVNFLKCTFHCIEKGLTAAVMKHKRKAVEELKMKGIIDLQKDANGKHTYFATQLGMAINSSSIQIYDGMQRFEAIKDARTKFVLANDLHLIYTIVSSNFALEMLQYGWKTEDFIEKLQDLIRNLDIVSKSVAELLGLTYDQLNIYEMQSRKWKMDHKNLDVARRFYIALALDELCNEVPLRNVCDKYRLNKGSIQTLTNTAGTFAGMLSNFCGKLGYHNLKLLLNQFHGRLFYNVKYELLDLMRIPSMSSKAARFLHQEGIVRAEDLATATVDRVELCLLTSGEYTESVPNDTAAGQVKSPSRVQCLKWLSNPTNPDRIHNMRDVAQLLIEEARRLFIAQFGVGNPEWKVQSQSRSPSPRASSSSRQDSLSQRVKSNLSASQLNKTSDRSNQSQIFTQLPFASSRTTFLGTQPEPEHRENDISEKLIDELQPSQLPVINESPSTSYAYEDSQMSIGNSYQELREACCETSDTQREIISILKKPKISPTGSLDDPVALSGYPDSAEAARLPSADEQQNSDFASFQSQCAGPRVRFATLPNHNEAQDTLLNDQLNKEKEEDFDMFDTAVDESEPESESEIPGNSSQDNFDSPPICFSQKPIYPFSQRPDQDPLSIPLWTEEEEAAHNLERLNREKDDYYSVFKQEPPIVPFTQFEFKGDSFDDMRSGEPVLVDNEKPETYQPKDKIRVTCCEDDTDLSTLFREISGTNQLGMYMSYTSQPARPAVKTAAKIGSRPTKTEDKDGDQTDDSIAISGVPHFVPSKLTSAIISIGGSRNVYVVNTEELLESFKKQLLKHLKPGTEIVTLDVIRVAVSLVKNFGATQEQMTSFRWFEPGTALWLLDPEADKIADQAKNREIINLLPAIPQLHDFVTAWKVFMLQEDKRKDVDDIGIWERCKLAAFLLPFRMELTRLLKKESLWKTFREVEMPARVTIAWMQLYGFGINFMELKELETRCFIERERAEEEAYKLVHQHFDIKSPKQVGEILYGKLRLHEKMAVLKPQDNPQGHDKDSPQKSKSGGSTDNSIPKTKKGNVKTDKETLEKLKNLHPVVNKIIFVRRMDAILSRGIGPIKEYVVHYPYPLDMPRVNGKSCPYTSTGRITMDNPNLLSVAKDFEEAEGTEAYSLRRVFCAAPNYVLISADYSQLELRILAHLSGEEGLLQVLQQGGDVFKSIAAKWKQIKIEEVTPSQRTAAKSICYGIIYGMGSKTLAGRLDVSPEEATSFKESFKESYPKIDLFIKQVHEACREKGFIETLLGRRRLLPLIKSDHHEERARAERQAVNTTVQGTAADLVKMAMNAVRDRVTASFSRCTSARLVLQLYDELIYEVHQSEKDEFALLLRTEMENCASRVNLRVPLPVNMKIGQQWGSLEDFKDLEAY